MSAIETLWVDTETRGRVNLRESGAYAYAETAEVLLVTYAFGDGPVQVIELGRGEVLPEELVRALTDPTIQKRAFNAEFDFLVLRHGQKLPLDSSQWACSSFQALYCGLPNSLANVTKVLRVTDKKPTASHSFASSASRLKTARSPTLRLHPRSGRSSSRTLRKTLQPCARLTD